MSNRNESDTKDEQELTDEELEKVSGGIVMPIPRIGEALGPIAMPKVQITPPNLVVPSAGAIKTVK